MFFRWLPFAGLARACFRLLLTRVCPNAPGAWRSDSQHYLLVCSGRYQLRSGSMEPNCSTTMLLASEYRSPLTHSLSFPSHFWHCPNNGIALASHTTLWKQGKRTRGLSSLGRVNRQTWHVRACEPGMPLPGAPLMTRRRPARCFVFLMMGGLGGTLGRAV